MALDHTLASRWKDGNAFNEILSSRVDLVGDVENYVDELDDMAGLLLCPSSLAYYK